MKHRRLLILLLLLTTPRFLFAAPIPLGSSLSPSSSSSWLSDDSSSFEFRFYVAPSGGGGFSAGVLFFVTGMPTTPAWSAGPDLVVSDSASFNLSSTGDLLLLPTASSPPSAALWHSATSGSGVSHAVLRDDGNLVLVNESGHELWQSFLNPSHTLLQNQTLNGGASLTNGDYRAAMSAAGNLTLSYAASAVDYWSSNTPGGSYAALRQTTDSVALGVYNSTGGLVAVWYPDDYTPLSNDQQIYRRVKLDDDGNLRIYSWSAGKADWSVGWQAVGDQCQVYGYCGPNGICTYDSGGGGPACSCAVEAGFGFVDPTDHRAGCSAPSDNDGHSCNGSAVMVTLNNTQLFLPTSFSTTRTYRYGASKCSLSCLNSQLCTAATSLNDGSGTCLWLVSDAGANFTGYRNPASSATTYLKFCGTAAAAAASSPTYSPSTPSSSGSRPAVIAAVVAAVVMLAAVLALQAAAWAACRQRFRSGPSARYAMLEYASGTPVQVSYRDLRKATGGFKEKLGEGAFGSVYRGMLPTADGGETEVAVKRLERLEGPAPAERQFRMEVAIIGSTHHMNLVRLCGFCAEGKHRLLVYEFMKNGSLDRYLFGGGGGGGGDGGDPAGGVVSPPPPPHLDWSLRYNIILGAARGLTYLHQECRDCIIHCDIKPENILLDDYFTAKLSDFGVAKLLSAAAARGGGGGGVATTLVRGTRGYLAPEWRSNLPITVKADVYAYGMVVLETVSGRRSAEAAAEANWRGSFMEWAYNEYFRNGRAEGVVDGRVLMDGGADMEELGRAMKVAFWCMQVQPAARPSMSRVIQMLEGAVVAETPPMPISMSFGEPFITSEDSEMDVGNGGSSGVSASTTGVSAASTTTSASSGRRRRYHPAAPYQTLSE